MNSIAMRIFSHLIRLLFIGLTLFVSQAFAQIYHVQEMNTEQIKALDREKTSERPHRDRKSDRLASLWGFASSRDRGGCGRAVEGEFL